MVEQQLVDYIKKAREAGQSDDQSRALLYKSGWIESEVGEAFSSLVQPQVKPQIQSQPQTQPQATYQPKAEVQPTRVVINKPQTQPQIQPQTQPNVQPQTQTKPSTTVSQDYSPKIKGNSGMLIKVLVGLAVLIVVGGGGYFAASQYFNFPWNPIRPNPETVVNNMLTNLATVKSSNTVIQGEISATDSKKVFQGKVAFNASGESDITDVNNPKGTGNLTITVTVPTPVSAGSSANVDMNVSVNMAVIGKTYYLKINNASILDAFSLGIDFSQIQGKWLKIDQNSLNVLSETEGMQTIDLTKTNNADLVKQIQNLIISEKMLSVTKELNDEKISGQDTYHYLVTITKAKLADLMSKIMALPELQQGVQDQIGFTPSMAQQFANAIGDTDAEIWVGKSDYMLYQVKLNKTIDLSAIFNANMQLNIKFNETSSNFNKPIIVQEPAGTQKIEAVILPLLKLGRISQGLLSIGDTAQTLFTKNKSYKSICYGTLLNGYLNTSGTTQNIKGAMLIDVNNAIVAEGVKKPVCFSAVSDYCVSTQLADGSYVCIDKNNAVGKTQCISATTVCQ